MTKGTGTHVATAGMDSCATVALAGWSQSAKEMNEAYKADPEGYSWDVDGMTVSSFFSSIIYPTKQELGETGQYPFTALMEELENNDLGTKLMITALNASQVMDGYWVKELEAHGFQQVDETKNTLGSVNHIFIRSTNRVGNWSLGTKTSG